jgi:hypothetical protein
MELTWRGEEGKYCNKDGLVVAMDPAIHEGGPHALVVHRKAFLDFLDKNNLAIFWTLLGEKRVLGGDSRDGIGRLELSGAYRLRRNKVEGGFHRKWVDFQREARAARIKQARRPSVSPEVLDLLRESSKKRDNTKDIEEPGK